MNTSRNGTGNRATPYLVYKQLPAVTADVHALLDINGQPAE